MPHVIPTEVIHVASRTTNVSTSLGSVNWP